MDRDYNLGARRTGFKCPAQGTACGVALWGSNQQPWTFHLFCNVLCILQLNGMRSDTIPEFSLESDSESDVSEDSDAFSGRLGSCAISMGVSLYSGLLPIRKETTKKDTFRRYKSFTLPAENHSQPCETSFTLFSRTFQTSWLIHCSPIHRAF